MGKAKPISNYEERKAKSRPRNLSSLENQSDTQSDDKISTSDPYPGVQIRRDVVNKQILDLHHVLKIDQDSDIEGNNRNCMTGMEQKRKQSAI